MTDEPIIETRGLSKRFGGVLAVTEVDFSVAPGQIRTIVGPNGAGKSTFFKLLLGSIRPDQGSIYFKGRDVTGLDPHRRALLGIGVKFQNLAVYEALTVRHNLYLPLRHHHGRRDVAGEISIMLERLKLAGKEDMLAGHLAHGQKQWLAIGMALAMQPKLLLLDEPCAGLGAEETEATVALIRSCNEQGIAAIVVEHDMAFVRQLGAPVTVLHYGRIFAEGSLAEIEQHEDVRRIYLGAAKPRRLRQTLSATEPEKE
ncbi:MAG: ABC transporter ATP-binding protein [Kiloniellales bacterium]